MGAYIAERFEPGLSVESLRADARRLLDAVVALQREGAEIELVGVTYLPDDESVFVGFTSTSEDLVGLAHERASVAYERIVEALPIEFG
jgi:hypothetical protein